MAGDRLTETESSGPEIPNLDEISLSEINRRLREENLRGELERKRLEREIARLQDLVLELSHENKRLKHELKQFKSPPQLVGQVVDMLDSGDVIVKNGAGQTFLVSVSPKLEGEALVVGSRISMDRNNLTIMRTLPASKDPVIGAAEIIEKPTTTFDDIGGLDEQITEIREMVELPLSKPHLFKEVGITPPKGVLLVGVPGTWKTLIAKAVAEKTNATFIRLVGSELVQKFIGEGGRLVRELFQMAREKAPAIVFIDEIDAIGAKRMSMDTTGDREVQRTLMQLLAEMDGFNPLENISILAATNRLDIIDEALLRPGRFDRIVEIPKPDREGIGKILEIHTRRMHLENVSLDSIADRLPDTTGAHIAAICREAGMFAIRNERGHVVQEDFAKAIDKLLGQKSTFDERMYR